jgi:alpha-2-macroglobulin
MKNKRTLIITAAVIVVAALALVLSGRGRQLLGITSSSAKINPAFREYISAFSGGVISGKSVIKIQFTSSFADSSLFDKELTEKYFDFQPAIEGKTKWLDRQTLAFIPNATLPQNTKYKARFHLYKLLTVSSELRTFEWEFATIRQFIEARLTDFYIYPGDESTSGWIEGVVLLADEPDNPEEVIKCLTLTQDKRQIDFKLIAEGKNAFRLHADSIQRGDKSTLIQIEWDGKPIKADGSGTSVKELPPLSEFSFLDFNVVGGNEPSLTLTFSDKLNTDQDLTGLISFARTNMKYSYTVESNKIKLFLSQNLSGEKEIIINKSIQNYHGKPLPKEYRIKVDFGYQKPQIRFIGKGVIVPGNTNHLMPFEAVGLRAVNVKITKIYENNILQFLQDNELDEGYSLYRVGKLIFNKNLRLTDATNPPLDLNTWNSYSLDLSKLISPEPGAIYRVTLGMKKEFTAFPCDETEKAELLTTWNEVEEDFEMNQWSYYNEDYDEDYDYYYEDYDYSQRDNPCNASYYSYGRNVSKNILASDIGLLAKTGKDNSCLVFANSITSSAPMSGVTIELYDFQQQLLVSQQTDAEGKCLFTLAPSMKPHFVVAKNGVQRAYLKLQNGNSLSLSAFDISGASVDKGLKGFIYGERGVWRPGDTLFLSFILEDKEKKLPAEIPVMMSIRNARSQVVFQQTRNNGLNGFYTFIIPTDPDAPTGNWRAEVRVGGAVFSKTIKVETIKPNRLKIDLSLSETAIMNQSQDEIKLNCRWLHGGIASGLRAEVEVTASPITTKFPKFPNFVFDDPARSFTSETQKLFEGRLNDEGFASFPSQIKLKEDPPGMLQVFFRTRVFERGGDFSIDGRAVTYSPYPTYVGLSVPSGQGYWSMLETKKKHVFTVAHLQSDGKPVGASKLNVEVYKIGWSWWWHRNYSSLAQYLQDEVNEPFERLSVEIKNGRGNFSMQVEDGDWGRYLVRVVDEEGNHSCGQFVYFDWPGYRRSEGKNDMASLLSFQADKETYNVDEDITLSIPSSAGGHALISIENGTKVIQSTWQKTTEGTTRFTFKAQKSMAPNIYVHVSLLQPHEQTVNDLPIRLYGLIPLKIEDPSTRLEPVISAPAKVRPESVMNVDVSEKTGKPMTYTLAVVDEGLLDLTRFKTPDPFAFFYAREALGVKTWDLYDMVAGAYAAAIQRILSIGGDDDLPGKSRNRANRFKPMVRFIGPFELKAGAKASHKINIPEYVGSVRVMVVAGQNSAYGNAETTTEVSKPLMVLGTLPRVAGPGEEILVPVSVFAADATVKNASVSISVNELFEVMGEKTKRVKFSKPGEELVFFKLKVKERLGVATVKIIAQSPSDKSSYSIEMDVRNPNPPVTIVVDTVLEAGKSWETLLRIPGIDGTNNLTLEVSSIPPLDLDRRLSYLINYPYGCLEQIVSAAFPQLYLTELVNVPEEQKARIERNIKHSIRMVSKFQNSEGSFSYWPGTSIQYDWVSSYAGHFLLAASEAGYEVNSSVLNKWISFQSKTARKWRLESTYYNSSFVQAYRLYTLALAKREELGAMNRLKAEPNMNISARWRLAAAYQIAGYNKVAESMVANLTTTIPNYRENENSFGSSLRDRAMILETLSMMKKSGLAAVLMRDISEQLSSDTWMNTQTTAYCLIAATSYLKHFKPTSEINLSYGVQGLGNLQLKTMSSLNILPLMEEGAGGNRTFFAKNQSKGTVFIRLIIKGTPMASEEPVVSRNMQLSISYVSTTGAPLQVERIKQGTDFVANISIANPGVLGNYTNLALNHVFPSGWEIRNDRLFDELQTTSSEPKNYVYRDVRDDRVYTFFNLSANRRVNFSIMLNAAYAGKYYLPGVVAEAMYDNNIFASTKGQWVEVVQE